LDFQKSLDQFKEYLDLNADNLALSTQIKYYKILRHFLLSCREEWTIEKINQFISSSNKLKDCYIYTYAFVPFLVSQGRKDLIDSLITVKRRPRKKVFRFVDKEIAAKIINKLSPKYRYIALLQIKAGARFREAATIRIENIDFNKGDKLIYITVGAGKGKSKGDKQGYIYLSKRYESLLRSLITRPFGYLSLEDRVEGFSEEQLDSYLNNMLRKYDRELNTLGLNEGIEGFSSHYLRHLFGDYFQKAGGSIFELQKLYRHARIDTTLGYSSLGESSAIDRLSNMEE